MNTRLSLTGVIAAALLAGCAGTYYGGHDYGPVAAVSYDGYYDGFYGPFDDGYWGEDGAFYYRDGNHHYQRDDAGHFKHEAAEGLKPVHGHPHGGHGGEGDHPKG
jgi:hypothetical protein